MSHVQLLAKSPALHRQLGARQSTFAVIPAPQPRYPHYDITELVARLATIYPATAQLLGVRAFDDVSYRFAARQVQRNRADASYGAGFANFLDEQAPAGTMPYVPAVAGLEWAVYLARRAPDTKTLRVDALDRFRRGKYRRIALILHPSCHLVRSRYPVLDLYRSARARVEAMECIPCASDGTRLLVQRLSTRVAFRGLAVDEFRFLAALRAGRTVNVARPHDAFDVHSAIARLAATGAIVGFAIRPSSTLQPRHRDYC